MAISECKSKITLTERENTLLSIADGSARLFRSGQTLDDVAVDTALDMHYGVRRPAPLASVRLLSLAEIGLAHDTKVVETEKLLLT